MFCCQFFSGHSNSLRVLTSPVANERGAARRAASLHVLKTCSGEQTAAGQRGLTGSQHHLAELLGKVTNAGVGFFCSRRLKGWRFLTSIVIFLTHSVSPWFFDTECIHTNSPIQTAAVQLFSFMLEWVATAPNMSCRRVLGFVVSALTHTQRNFPRTCCYCMHLTSTHTHCLFFFVFSQVACCNASAAPRGV